MFGTSRRAAAGSPDGVTMLACDVTDDESVAKLVDRVLAEAGWIDLLVNNAGVGLLGGAEGPSTAQAQARFECERLRGIAHGPHQRAAHAQPEPRPSPRHLLRRGEEVHADDHGEEDEHRLEHP